MKKNLLLFFFMITGAAITGCSDPHSVEKEHSGSVYLRIANSSSVEFTSVYVSFPGTEATFEHIPPGETSTYKGLDTAYRYGYVEVKTGTGKYRLQPYDYVGEKALEDGQYTYQLSLDGGSVTLTLVED